jgi:hypothetical protein
VACAEKSDGVYLIQMLLPRTGSDGVPLDDSVFAQTRAELVDAFEGVTAYLRSPAQGAWVAPDGRVERDDVVMVEVLTGAFDRAWWREYAGTLARRFRQEAIHIRALPALTPETREPSSGDSVG